MAPSPDASRSCSAASVAERGVVPADVVAVGEPEAGRLARRARRHGVQPAQRLHHRSEHDVARVGAVPAEPGHAHVDQAGTPGRHRRPTTVPTTRATPGLKFSSTTSQCSMSRNARSTPSGWRMFSVMLRLLRFRLFHSPLCSIDAGSEPGRLHAVAEAVQVMGPLDLDHLGAEVGQDLRALRPRDHPREVEDANAVEQSGRHRRALTCPVYRGARRSAQASTASRLSSSSDRIRRVSQLPRQHVPIGQHPHRRHQRLGPLDVGGGQGDEPLGPPVGLGHQVLGGHDGVEQARVEGGARPPPGRRAGPAQPPPATAPSRPARTSRARARRSAARPWRTRRRRRRCGCRRPPSCTTRARWRSRSPRR